MSEELTKKQRRGLRKQEKIQAQEEKQKLHKRAARMKALIGVGIVIGVLVAAVLWMVMRPEATNVANTGAEDPSMGPEDAEIVIRTYSDYQCPYCALAEAELLEFLTTRDGIRFEFNDYPLAIIHPNAKTVAVVSECAFRTGGNELFWDVHTAIFEQQAEWSVSKANMIKSDILDIAAEAGADREALETCYDAGDARSAVDGDQQEGRELDINSTPTFFINDERVVGGLTAEEWATAVEEIESEMEEVTETDDETDV